MLSQRLCAACAAGALALASPRAQVAWTQLSPAQSPSARTAHGLVYDEAHHVAVLFGGGNANLSFDETWLWDSSTWRQVTPATSPSPRKGHGMVYDSARGRIVLFGGGNNAGVLYGDTWEWDGTTWTRVATTGPSPRWNAGIAYDPVRQRTVLVDGSNLTKAFRETWEWDGSTWTLVSTEGPTARIGPGLAWDGNRGTVLLYGGIDFYANPPMAADTWEWNGHAWTMLAQTGPALPLPYAPYGLYAVSMVWNPAIRRVVLSGGASALPPVLFGPSSEQTHEWDGSAWRLRTTYTRVIPPVTTAMQGGRAYSQAMYDPVRESVVLFGGSDYAAWPGVSIPLVILGDTLEYAPMDPARSELFGAACAGSTGVLALAPVAQQRPWIGETFDVELSSLPIGAPAWMTVGISNTTFLGNPLPLALGNIGAPGCALWSSVELSLPVANASGTATLAIALSPDRSLIGQKFYLQGLALDVSGKLITSASLENTVGSR